MCRCYLHLAVLQSPVNQRRHAQATTLAQRSTAPIHTWSTVINDQDTRASIFWLSHVNRHGIIHQFTINRINRQSYKADGNTGREATGSRYEESQSTKNHSPHTTTSDRITLMMWRWDLMGSRFHAPTIGGLSRFICPTSPTQDALMVADCLFGCTAIISRRPRQLEELQHAMGSAAAFCIPSTIGLSLSAINSCRRPDPSTMRTAQVAGGSIVYVP
jgi:hypothetical protein